MRPFAALVVLSLVAEGVRGASPISGFRPPSTPILSQSPLINVFSPYDSLNDGDVTHWTGSSMDMFSGVRVDGQFYLLMGNPCPSWNATCLTKATQTGLSVFATQTVFTFAAGPVAVTATFTSPQIPGDYDLMSRPCHYFTYSFVATDGASHAVAVYQDITSYLVQQSGKGELIAFSRVPLPSVGAEALSLGSVTQATLSSTNDKPTWGVAYLSYDTSVAGSAAALELSYTTRNAFAASGTLPSSDNPTNPQPQSGSKGPATGPQPGIDRGGNDMPGSPFNLPSADPNLCWGHCNSTAGCLAWAYAIPNCDGFSKPTCWLKSDYGTPSPQKCRVSGAQAGWPMGGGNTIAAAAAYTLTVGSTAVDRVFMVSVDEILGINWFGELMPPWWRRALPVNSTAVVPTDMLEQGWGSIAATRSTCNDFDALTALKLSAAGGDEYATIAQLTYRQVWAGQMLVFSPSRNSMWYFLKEISSCGCLQTADVIYPAFPQVLYYDPELAKLWMISHLEYAMNRTSEPYPMPWAPHHLGYWPLADLPASRQENMPLEETAWDLLIIAAIAQRQGGDLTWLEPYWRECPPFSFCCSAHCAAVTL